LWSEKQKGPAMQIQSLFIPDHEFEFEFVRSPGAGGQNVNKVNSKAVLRWAIVHSPSLPEPVRQRFIARWPQRITVAGEIVLTSSRHRDQLRNKEDVLEKLAEMISEVLVPPKPRKKTKPSKGAIQRRLNEKKLRSQTKARRRGDET
jgi:ribosome-associated protein